MNVKRYARLAGILFLVSLIGGGFGEAYAPAKIIGSGDAAAAVANIKNFDLIYRLGFVGFLLESLSDITLAWLFYVLLKPVNRNVSLLAAFFGLMATALFAFAELFYFAPTLMVGSPGYLQTFSAEQINSLVMLSMKFYSFAGMIFTAYYGVGWLVRAYLMFQSTYLPKFLAVLMAIGGAGFVTRNFLMILKPAYASDVLLMLMVPGGLFLTGWLLIKGVDQAKFAAAFEKL